MIDRERITESNQGVAGTLKEDVEHLADQMDREAGVGAEDVIQVLTGFSVAAPSWAVGTGGTRFGRFPIGGEPRTTEEKIDDVAALECADREQSSDLAARPLGRS